MKVLYRISDGGFNKIKPEYVTKRGVFHHFMKIFKDYDVYVIADNISEDTYQFLKEYLPENKIIRTSLNNCLSLRLVLRIAIDNFNDDESVYFAEDDYIYKPNAPKIIEEGLTIADYVSGYDHPDKYMNHNEGGPNPFINEGGEDTKVLLTKSSHWKITNSTCMTFAAKVKTIKEDIEIFFQHTQGYAPNDFNIFLELKNKNNRKLITSIPGVSTHGETKWLAPLTNWEEEFNKTNNT